MENKKQEVTMEEEFKQGTQSVSQSDGWTRNTTNEMGATQDVYTGQAGDEGMQDSYGSYDTNPAGNVAEKPVNMITGIVGAFLGVLIGVVLWVLIYQMGYIAGIAGVVMMVCAFKGFELLGGRVNLPGAVICVIMVLAAVYFSHNIAMAVSIMQELDGYSFGTAYQSIPFFRDMSSDFDTAYIRDLAVGYALTLVAIIPSIKNMLKRK